MAANESDEEKPRVKKMKFNDPKDNRFGSGESEEFMMKKIIRFGSGESTLTQGDHVIYHITISSLDGNILWSTRSALGGNGIPSRDVVGRTKLKLLQGIKTMNKGEIAMITYTIKAELLYDNDVGESQCRDRVD